MWNRSCLNVWTNFVCSHCATMRASRAAWNNLTKASITPTPNGPNPCPNWSVMIWLATIRISILAAIANPTALVMTFLESPVAYDSKRTGEAATSNRFRRVRSKAVSFMRHTSVATLRPYSIGLLPVAASDRFCKYISWPICYSHIFWGNNTPLISLMDVSLFPWRTAKYAWLLAKTS